MSTATNNDVTFPDFPSDAQTPVRPAWAVHGEHTYASYYRETDTYGRGLCTPDVKLTADLSVRLYQGRRGIAAPSPVPRSPSSCGTTTNAANSTL